MEKRLPGPLGQGAFFAGRRGSRRISEFTNLAHGQHHPAQGHQDFAQLEAAPPHLVVQLAVIGEQPVFKALGGPPFRLAVSA
jgi:hypothetical protein